MMSDDFQKLLWSLGLRMVGSEALRPPVWRSAAHCSKTPKQGDRIILSQTRMSLSTFTHLTPGKGFGGALNLS